MNYMKQVAQMLGVELEEEFKLDDSDYKYKIDKDGMKWYCEYSNDWNESNHILLCVLFGKYEIIKKPILDDIERRYLSNIIKPFRDRVVSIVKYDDYDRCECIVIKYRNINGYTGRMYFPAFEKDTMYKGMKANKKYTLEELGL